MKKLRGLLELGATAIGGAIFLVLSASLVSQCLSH